MTDIARYAATLLAAAAVLVTVQPVSASDTMLFNLGCESGSCLVDPWDSQATTAEFRRNGMRLEVSRQNLSYFARIRYDIALNAFPDAASCLSQAEADANGFDLLTFDWAAQSSVEQLEVCLSRIHNVIDDPSVSVRWFEAFGFKAVPYTEPAGHFREGQTIIQVNWVSDSEFPAQYVSSWLERTLFGTGFSMGLRLDADNTVQDVSITFNRK